MQLQQQQQLQLATAFALANASEAGNVHEICVQFMLVCGMCKVR